MGEDVEGRCFAARPEELFPERSEKVPRQLSPSWKVGNHRPVQTASAPRPRDRRKEVAHGPARRPQKGRRNCRPLESETSICARSEDTEIPGNQGLSEAARAARVDEVFWPYHRAIEAELERREAAGEETVLVAVHSFTPIFRGDDRKWHGGVLYGEDARLAAPVGDLLRAEGLVIGDNEPYAVSEATDYGVIVYGERRGHLYVELEVRQDLVSDGAGQVEWAERLARILPVALERARQTALQ